ncbi:MAG: hypothetical protein HY675_10570 [Chloroflexi bacterium]|nr:hypothetical protein [Chloroflexota bacterium]
MAADDIQFKLKLADCMGLREPEHVIPTALMLSEHGFLPSSGDWPNQGPVEDIHELVRKRTVNFESTGTWCVGFPVEPQWTGHLLATFECEGGKERPTSCRMGALIDREDCVEVEPFAERLVRFGLYSYPLVRPAIGYIDKSWAKEPFPADVQRRKLVSLGWVNFFGPPYVEKYGRDFLSGIPGYRVEELPDGGVFHQLSPTFLVEDAAVARSLRQEVKDYCAKAGVKISCQAPYVHSQVFGKGEYPASQGAYRTFAEFRLTLLELFRTALVLDDGTRVKVVCLDWETLTKPQREYALDAIRRAAQAELSKHPDVRILFEFNEIPADLDAVMDRLARAEPRLSYARVDMS